MELTNEFMASFTRDERAPEGEEQRDSLYGQVVTLLEVTVVVEPLGPTDENGDTVGEDLKTFWYCQVTRLIVLQTHNMAVQHGSHLVQHGSHLVQLYNTVHTLYSCTTRFTHCTTWSTPCTTVQHSSHIVQHGSHPVQQGSHLIQLYNTVHTLYKCITWFTPCTTVSVILIEQDTLSYT